ncbi:hypothetical protein B0H14DRAFT_3538091 [Mycena olivaceomarginata]|nr:hypothetical protein B0H14DRAFT_3538091 [Mycena olivaceomarginata]
MRMMFSKASATASMSSSLSLLLLLIRVLGSACTRIDGIRHFDVSSRGALLRHPRERASREAVNPGSFARLVEPLPVQVIKTRVLQAMGADLMRERSVLPLLT